MGATLAWFAPRLRGTAALSDYSIIRWTAELCVAGAVLGCIYALLVSVLVVRYARARNTRRGAAIPVSILKPLHGTEPRLFAQLASFCNQDYGAPIQIVFGTQDPHDPALSVVERLKAALPDKRLDVKIDSREHGSNRKVSNLVNMMPLARHDVLIVADSDIKVGPNYLSQLIAELQTPGVGAVTCLYHGIGGAGIWSRLAASAINTHFIPQVIMALGFRLAQPCFGATIAIRRETLNRIGGFSSFADYLAEDYAMGDSVRALGEKVTVPPFVVGHVCYENDMAELLDQQLRFSRTIRSIDPIGYAGSIITHPLPLALIAALLGGEGTIPLLVAVLACRGILCLAVERAFGFSGESVWLIPLQDLISFGAYCAAFFGTAVNWHGQRYRLSNGRLVPDQSETAP